MQKTCARKNLRKFLVQYSGACVTLGYKLKDSPIIRNGPLQLRAAIATVCYRINDVNNWLDFLFS